MAKAGQFEFINDNGDLLVLVRDKTRGAEVIAECKIKGDDLGEFFDEVFPPVPAKPISDEEKEALLKGIFDEIAKDEGPEDEDTPEPLDLAAEIDKAEDAINEALKGDDEAEPEKEA